MSQESKGAAAREVSDELHSPHSLSSTCVFREYGGADFTVTKEKVAISGLSQELTFHYASVKEGRTGVICICEREMIHRGVRTEELLLGLHWRVALSQWCWEFPRGMGEQGEGVKDTAIRELREETGYTAVNEDIDFLQELHADGGVVKDSIAVVKITSDSFYGDMPSNSHKDWELTRLQWIPVSSFRKMIVEGKIVDGLTLAAFTIWREIRDKAEGKAAAE